MSNAVQAQHPAVVLRSTYQLVRMMLAVATIAIVGLTIAITVLAVNSGSTTAANAISHTTQSATGNYPGHDQGLGGIAGSLAAR